MKKIIVAILAILYMGSSTGATIHMHYCMGKLVNMGLSDGESKKCNKCASKEKTSACSKECCKDLHKTIKLEKDQKTVETGLKLIEGASVTTTALYPDQDLNPLVFEICHTHPVVNGPPGHPLESYIFQCSFLI
jgi:hypothetical protein